MKMETNKLYPIFLKTANLHILIIGGGNVAEEKLSFLTKSSPDAKVTVVAPMFREGTLALASQLCSKRTFFANACARFFRKSGF